MYVNKNQISDKYYASRWNFWRLIPDSILFQPGVDKFYAEKRKALSGAFFKSKLLEMTKIIK